MKLNTMDYICHVKQQKTLCFTRTEFAAHFMGYLHGLGKMGRRERESIKYGCPAYWLGNWKRSHKSLLVYQ